MEEKKRKTKKQIYRRKKTVCVSFLYDMALPMDFLFSGIFQASQEKKTQPTIQIHTEPKLSPFVVQLHKKSNILKTEPSSETNLLEEIKQSISLAKKITQKDLFLLPQDSREQLQESDLTQKTSSSVSHPSFPPSQDLLSFFDLPEEEENLLPTEDESEPILLEDLQTFTKTECIFQEKKIKKQRQKLFFHLPKGWHKALACFLLFSLVFLLPVHAMGTIEELRTKKSVMHTQGLLAASSLQAARTAVGHNQNFSEISFDLHKAQTAFASAASVLQDAQKDSVFLLSILPLTKTSYTSSKSVLKAGEQLTTAAAHLADLCTILQSQNDVTLTKKLELISQELTLLLPLLQQANQELMQVSSLEGLEISPSFFSELKTQLPVFLSSLERLLSFSDIAQTILGAKEKQRYLFLFQNNMEIRPTGGFMGSFAEIEIEQGEVVGLHLPEGGSYDVQGNLPPLAAPEPLQLINSRFEFQDSNWFADFPTSARKILHLYEASGGSTVDGVFAVNATFVANLLSLLGSLQLPNYKKTFTAENFILEAEKISQEEYKTLNKPSERKEDAPKAFLGELAPLFLQRLKQTDFETLFSVLQEIQKGLTQKDIQIYLTKEEQEKKIKELGWDGSVHTADQDYLLLINTNLGGGKTDGAIKENVNLDVHILEDGSVLNTLTITRTHQGIKNERFTGVHNVNYVRAYVPKGSELIAANGFVAPAKNLFEIPEKDWQTDDDIFFTESHAKKDENSGTIIAEEFGKTVFGNWIQTEAGETSVASFIYRLPFSFQSLKNQTWKDHLKSAVGLSSKQRYTLLLQKQSGILQRETQVQVYAPSWLETVWSSLEGGQVTLLNDTDNLYGLLFEAF